MGESLFRNSFKWLSDPIEVSARSSEKIFFEETLFCTDSQGIRVPIHRDAGWNMVNMFGVVTGDLKYISTRADLAREDGGHERIDLDEVYFLDRDPHESADVDDERLEGQLFDTIKQNRSGLLKCKDRSPEWRGIDEKTMEDLESLGYVER